MAVYAPEKVGPRGKGQQERPIHGLVLHVGCTAKGCRVKNTANSTRGSSKKGLTEDEISKLGFEECIGVVQGKNPRGCSR